MSKRTLEFVPNWGQIVTNDENRDIAAENPKKEQQFRSFSPLNIHAMSKRFLLPLSYISAILIHQRHPFAHEYRLCVASPLVKVTALTIKLPAQKNLIETSSTFSESTQLPTAKPTRMVK